MASTQLKNWPGWRWNIMATYVINPLHCIILSFSSWLYSGSWSFVSLKGWPSRQRMALLSPTWPTTNSLPFRKRHTVAVVPVFLALGSEWDQRGKEQNNQFNWDLLKYSKAQCSRMKRFPNKDWLNFEIFSGLWASWSHSWIIMCPFLQYHSPPTFIPITSLQVTR